MKKLALIAALVVLMLASGTGTVLADKSYHSTRLPLALTPEGEAAGHTLLSGEIVNIHPNGPVNGAIEVYQLHGALPNTDYEVVWDIGGWRPMPTGVTLTTDRAGNAYYVMKISRDWQIENGYTDVYLFVRWTMVSGGGTVYETDWHTVYID